MTIQSEATTTSAPPVFGEAVYFDGRSNRKRKVALRLEAALEIFEQGLHVGAWPYGEVRSVHERPGTMRLRCTKALPLARLEISEPAVQQAIAALCPALEAAGQGRVKTGKIVFWSLAAVCSIVGLSWFGIPFAADRLAPYVPFAFEKRMGDAVDGQVRRLFGGKECDSGPGHAAFLVLVNKLKDAGGLELPFQAHVMSSGMPNAFALPGGRIYLLDGLLQRARSPDELAGILAHELGHVQHRDGMRRLIQTGGTSFLFGLLFGDVTGAGAVIFVSRSMLDASYSRDAERNADAFAVGVMHKLGRSPTPSGELLFRITGAQTDKSLTILSSHPLTEERLAEMKKADRAATGPELLSAAQWAELKGICKWQAPNLRFDTLPGRAQSPQPKWPSPGRRGSDRCNGSPSLTCLRQLLSLVYASWKGQTALSGESQGERGGWPIGSLNPAPRGRGRNLSSALMRSCFCNRTRDRGGEPIRLGLAQGKSRWKRITGGGAAAGGGSGGGGMVKDER